MNIGISSTNIGQRKKGGSSIAILLQPGNHFLRYLVIFRYNILQSAAQSNFNGCLIFLIQFQNVCHNAYDTRILLFLLHNVFNGLIISVVTFRDRCQRFVAGTGAQILLIVLLILQAKSFFFFFLPPDPVFFLFKERKRLLIGCLGFLQIFFQSGRFLIILF